VGGSWDALPFINTPAADVVIFQHPGGPAEHSHFQYSGESGSLTPEGYALALALCAGLPLAFRAGLLGFLADFEPSPADVQEAAVTTHLSGHMARGRLTPDGVRAALEALEGLALPPRSIRGPTGPEGGRP